MYLYYFAKYTNWPTEKKVIKIGFIGKTQLLNEFENLTSSKKEKFEIQTISESEAINFDIVVISQSSASTIKTVKLITDKKPILIVSEKENTNYQGACIAFCKDEEDNFKTRYQISPFNLRSRQLTISENLIQNAIIVR